MMDTILSKKKDSYKIFDQIAPTYDLLNRFLSFGIDQYWRKQVLKTLGKYPKRYGLKVLDLASGTGDLALTLVKSPAVDHIEGVDLSKKMVEIGQKKISKKGYSDKIKLTIGDAANLNFEDDQFDAVTISFGIRNFHKLKESLSEINRVLKPKGRVLIMEFSLPRNFIIKKFYLFYFRYLLPFVGRLISKHNDAYSYLNKTVEDFPYGDDFSKILERANLVNVSYRELTFGICTIYSGEKKEIGR